MASKPWHPRSGAPHCARCESTDRPHYARDLCQPCYLERWRERHYEHWRAAQQVYQARWRAKQARLRRPEEGQRHLG